jgi:hypothetical protein
MIRPERRPGSIKDFFKKIEEIRQVSSVEPAEWLIVMSNITAC